MANTVPATYPAPSPLAVSTGLPLTEGRVSPLIRAVNYVRAHLGRQALISQAFPVTAGVYTYRDAKAAYGSGPSARWRIPQVPEMTSVQVWVSCHTSGARTTHEVKVTSVNGGDAVTITPTATPTIYGPLDLDVAYSSGVEDIRLWSHGDGATPVRIESILVRAPVLSSPLATGTRADSFVAFDADELDALKAASADLAAQMRRDLDALAATPRVYLNWSALEDTDEAGDQQNDQMHARTHAVACPVWDGTQARGRKLTIWARASNAAGTKHVTVLSGPTLASVQSSTIIDIPGGTADAWFNDEIELQERAASGAPSQVLPMGPGLNSALLSVWPDASYRADAIGPRRLSRILPQHVTTAPLMSLAIWGR